MSTMSIFSKNFPSIGEISFDAKLEEATSKSVQLTQYPLEVGAHVTDHAILLPNRYILTGAVSNTPLGLGMDEGGVLGINPGDIAQAVGGVAGAAITTVSAYLLAGDKETRASSAWAALTALLERRAPFTLQTELEDLENMVLLRLDQRTLPENEDGLVFIAELQQIRLIGKGKVGRGVISADQLMKDDPVSYQGAPMIHTGQASVEKIN